MLFYFFDDFMKPLHNALSVRIKLLDPCRVRQAGNHCMSRLCVGSYSIALATSGNAEPPTAGWRLP
jgi:hypothetical protein